MVARRAGLVATLVLTAQLLLSAPALAASTTETKPRVLALYYHADWCGPCKTMGPIFRKLVASDRGNAVAYIKLDLTDRIGIGISQEVAAGYGITDIFRYSRNTGVIMLVDAESLATIEELNLNLSAVEMAHHIDAAVAKRQGRHSKTSAP